MNDDKGMPTPHLRLVQVVTAVGRTSTRPLPDERAEIERVAGKLRLTILRWFEHIEGGELIALCVRPSAPDRAYFVVRDRIPIRVSQRDLNSGFYRPLVACRHSRSCRAR